MRRGRTLCSIRAYPDEKPLVLTCDTEPMTMTSPATAMPERVAMRRTILMCRPEHFTVDYRINPWMDPDQPTDTALAVRQWEVLHRTYVDLGFEVHLIDPVVGLPDMVYAANGGLVIDGIAYGALFQYDQRGPEGPAYMEWFGANGFRVAEPVATNEGEGDFLLVGETIYAGTGFRSDTASHDEVRRIYDREVVTLRLVDPRFYHLDTAFAVLDSAGGPDSVAYLPSAFDPASRGILQTRFPDAVLVTEEDAAVLGLNSFSDGRNVVIAQRAVTFERDLRARGFTPIGVDLSELLRGGGGVKCCTLELRP